MESLKIKKTVEIFILREIIYHFHCYHTHANHYLSLIASFIIIKGNLHEIDIDNFMLHRHNKHLYNLSSINQIER